MSTRLGLFYAYVNFMTTGSMAQSTGSLAQWVECSPMVREDLCSIPGRVIPKTLKMVLDTSLLNTPAI